MKNQIWHILFWIGFLALCGFAVVGCLRPNQPIIGPPAPYDPLQQVAKSVAATNWLVTVSILATALSVAAFFNGSRIALGVLVGSITSLIMALMVARYATVMAFIGLVFAVGVIVYSVVVKNKALFEIFKTTKVAKDELHKADIRTVFANGSDTIANKIQSLSTRKIVDKLQKRFGK